MIRLIDYEKNHNPLLRALTTRSSESSLHHGDVLPLLRGRTLLLPQSVTLEGEPTASFVKSHVIVFGPLSNDSDSLAFVTLQGCMGLFSPNKERVRVASVPLQNVLPLSEELSSAAGIAAVLQRGSDMLARLSFVNKGPIDECVELVVIDRGVVELENRGRGTLLPLVLVSAPVCPTPVVAAENHQVVESSGGLLDTVKRSAASRFEFLGGLSSTVSGRLPTLRRKSASDEATTPRTVERLEEEEAKDAAAEQEAAAAAIASFYARIARPDASDVLARLKAFVREFVTRDEQGMLPVEKRASAVARFVTGMSTRIAQHPAWQKAGQAEMMALADALENYACTKLHRLLFRPDAPPDQEKNRALYERLASLAWIEPVHLDLAEEPCKSPKLDLAVAELRKLDQFKTPRDKLVCILNACKVLYSVAAQSAGADELLPLLIVTLLRANPPHLYSHTHFIGEYRHPQGLNTEPGYYYTQLMSAIAFLEQCDATRLTISPEEFAARMSAPSNKERRQSLDLLSFEMPTSRENLTVSLLSDAVADPFLEIDSAETLTREQVADLLASYKRLVDENRRLRDDLARDAMADAFTSPLVPTRASK